MESPPLIVDVRREDGVVVVAPRGEIDLATAPRVRDALRAAGSAEVVLDLTDVDFLDTSGLYVVLEHQRAADQRGLRFAIVPGSREIRRLFEMTGLLHRLTFVREPADLVGNRGAG